MAGKRLPELLYICILLLMVRTTQGQQLNFRHLTVENGLSQNAIMSMVQDKQGFMWYGTRYGLNRYDGTHFRIYKSIPGNKNTITDNVINALLVDSEGILWVGTSMGLCRYNEQMDVFDRVPLSEDGNRYVSYLFEDDNRQLWVGTDRGLLHLADKKNNRFNRPFPGLSLLETRGNMVRCIYKARDGRFWAGTTRGLVCVDPDRQYHIYTQDGRPGSLTNDCINTIAEDRGGRIWIGTLNGGLYTMDQPGIFHPYQPAGQPPVNNNIRKILPAGDGRLWVGTQDGLSIIDPVRNQVSVFRHDPEITGSLSNNSIHSLYQDRSGTMWIGTYHGGINLLYSYTTPFHIYRNTRLGSSISSNIISSITADEKQNLWIGTEERGLNYYNRETGVFTSYKNNPGDKSTVSSNLIKVVYRDHEGQIWTGTTYSNGLNLYLPGTGRFKHIAIDNQTGSTIRFDEILALQQTSDGILWIGAQSGLSTLQRNAHGQYPDRAVSSILNNRLPNQNIHALYEDTYKNLWIGTGAGLCMYTPSNDKLVRYLKKEGDAQSLQSDAINCITEDSKGNIWIGTFYGGLSRYDKTSGKFITYTDRQGLSNNNVLSILEDGEGNLWLGTDNGLAKFNPAQRSFKIYTTSDGIAGNKFSANAFYKDNKGLFYFGGNNGLTSFLPSSLETNAFAAPVRFTSLQLYGNTVGIHDENGLLDKDISFTQHLRFKPDQSNFTIEYAILNFIKPEKNKYAYMLEGIEQHWNYTANTSATYTNLPAGHYTFLVKGANNDGIWTAEPARLEITILPPIWKTWYAYTLYILVLATVIFFFLRFFWLRALFRREHELQQFKLNFFTNISHEIRTHLSLISGPVEKLLQRHNETGTQQQLEHVKSNADRLMHLVGELMDFRKAETNNLPLHVTGENIVRFTGDIYSAFTDLAAARNIHTSYTYSADVIEVYFDKRQMEKVIFNLLTNAFKFTPDNGTITLCVQEHHQEIQIQVTDNGKGIAPENLKKLFVNFFQVNDDTAHNTGYGIGLALSRSIVELHKGSLTVTSQQPAPGREGKTTFTVSLLKGHRHFNSEQLHTEHQADTMLLKPVLPAAAAAPVVTGNDKKPILLLVEDNAELRSFITASLSDSYEVTSCVNGLEGWQIAIELIPDLIISDVMMPEMDGFTLCTQLKQDIRTSHIPVVLLTAKAAHENHVAGLTSGADAYLTKPFSMQVLELHARNLVASRKAIRLKFSQQLVAVATPAQPQLPEASAALSPADQVFLQQVFDIIEEYMDDPALNVSLLSEKMAMSTPVLYKKLKAITGLTVNDFMKSLRLKKAARLLMQGDLNVSEVAYAVGFNRRKYFSEEFKKVYGKTPTEYIQQEKT